MRFKPMFERLEQRENPSATGGDYALPPVDPVIPPPGPTVDPGSSGQNGNGIPPADPAPPVIPPT